jgi:hypothetical protein
MVEKGAQQSFQGGDWVDSMPSVQDSKEVAGAQG